MIDFDEMINNFLAREQRAKQEGRYYPSEIGSCIRKTWYSYKHPQEVRPDLLKIFHLGNILHDFVADVLSSEKNPGVELLKAEFPLRLELDDFLMSGRVDDLLLLKADGKSVLVEVKSHGSLKFVSQPSQHHIMQLQFYMHASGVHNGMLLYIDRANLQSKTFDIDYDETMARMVIERFRELHSHLKAGALPRPEAKQDSEMQWMCRYCEYFDKCGRDEA